MCGICGYISFGEPIREKEGILRAMGGLQSHRGPDADGYHLDGQVGLGHRRLSIIDLSGGAQPMGDSEGNWVVFNGEIYNFPELRKELEAKGRVFRTRSDTEVILHGYAAWGVDVVKRLNGMFAFALWDPRRKRLFAARDRLGKKPLYYHLGAYGFLFASEMKSLLTEPKVPREVDREAVDKFFSYGYIPAPLTIFKGISKLRPGHFLTLEDGKVEVQGYWDVRYAENRELRTEDDYVDRLAELLTDAVKRRLLSEVPLGAFLSGGLDSSAVVGTMAKVSEGQVRTFTIGFEEAGFSEIEDARRVAGIFGTRHREFTVKADAVGLLPDLVWHFDEPFGDSSAVPTYYVSRMARQEVTVVLSGDGGDELFAGYNHYRMAQDLARYKAIPRALRRHVLGPLGRMLPVTAKGKFLLQGMGVLEEKENWDAPEMYPPIKSSLFSAEALRSFAGLEPAASSLRYWREAPAGPSLSRMQYLDTKVYLPEDILMKVDRMSMANSLETRAPLLDYNIVEFAATIPEGLQRKDGRGKYILRKAVERLLPREVLQKPKQGFAIPREKWFQGALKDYAKEVLLSRQCLERGWFRESAVRLVLDQHASGARDYSMWIWCLLNFELWHRCFLDGGTRRI